MMFFLRGEIGVAPDERDAGRELADKLRLPELSPEHQLERLDPFVSEVVKGYAVQQEGAYYLCGLVGFHKRDFAVDAFDVREDLRDQAAAAFRRWARTLDPPHEMDFVSFEESQRLLRIRLQVSET
jgi:hypothetical protein